MFIINRLIPPLAAVLVWLCFQLIIWFPAVWYIFEAILIIILIVLIVKLVNWDWHRQALLAFLITTIALAVSASLFMFFIDGSISRLFFVILISLLIGYYLNNIFLFIYRQKTYRPYALENISGYLNLLSQFLFVSGFFSLILFFNTPLFICIISIFTISVLLTLQTLWIHKINLKKARLFLLIVGLVMAELFWAVHFLPTSFLVNALLLTIIYYVAMMIGLNYFSEQMDKKLIKRSLLIGAIMILLLLVTAQWT